MNQLEFIQFISLRGYLHVSKVELVHRLDLQMGGNLQKSAEGQWG